ncbi:protein transport protein Sec24A isoform X2 [Latimeria chalumnae]
MQPQEMPAAQGYNVAPHGMYRPQMPAKAPSQPPPGQYNYGYPNIPPISSYPGPGQTVRLPLPPMGPPQQAGPVPRVSPIPPNSAAVSASNSVYTGAPLNPPANWQPGAPPQAAPRPISNQTNHMTSQPGVNHSQPLPPPSGYGSFTPPAGSQHAPPPGVPPPQKSYMKPGPTFPSVYQPGKLHLGPPPLGFPPQVRPTAPPTGLPSMLPNQLSTNTSAKLDGGNCVGNFTDGSGFQNNYDTVEGGGFMGHTQPWKPPVAVGHSYPSLPPGYQNATPPGGAPQSQPAVQRHPSGQLQYPQPPMGMNQLSSALGGLSLQPSQQPEGLRPINLLQERKLLPPSPVRAPLPNLHRDLQRLNCSPEVFRCTLTNIPQTQSLLNKAKLPLGLMLHPFKDLSQLPVVTSSTIVRCRSCRTYINPFVSFIDQRRWKCNLCYRVNDVPEEFMYNPVTRSYGEPQKRPEVQNATIEFIAPSEYMLRPPQPAVYLFMLDVSHNAVQTGYLETVCQSLLENLSSLPGDSRTKIAFITYDSMIHFYSFQEGASQPQMLVVSDIDDVFIPMPENLLVNLNESKELVHDLLKILPKMFTHTMETQSALGPALQAAFKLVSSTGGRVAVFQTQLPSVGAGALKSREDPNQRASAKDIQHLSPATDFYKKLALDCSGQQIAVDLFLLSGQYSDLASLAGISRYSAGCIYYYPSYHQQHNPVQVEKFQKELKRYLTRKIGFEAVMRIRCTKGLSIHTFHGNFFVRSTDLLSLPNVNPDAGFAVQMSIEDNLTDMQVVSFQAALLYTSSKGERRIRVHTMCLPVVSSLADIYAGADVQAIIGLLANMGVDRSVSASLSDARDALVNAVIDSLSAYRSSVLSGQQPGLMTPSSLRLFPLFVLALLKQKAFRTGTSTRLDDRVYAMCQVKSQALVYLMLMVHPNLYRVDKLTDEGAMNIGDKTIPQPPLLQLSVEKLSKDGAFLMDAGSVMFLWIGRNCEQTFLSQVLGVPSYAAIPQNMTQLPELDTAESSRMRAFISWLREQRPFFPLLHVIRDESPLKASFLQNMIEDRTESALSYYEFLLHVQQQVNK